MDVISYLSKKLEIDEKFFEIPKDTSLGDIACKFAFTKEDKIKYAEQLAKKAGEVNIVKLARNVGPYVNIFLDWGKLGNGLLKEKLEKGKNKGKIIIEHTSTNPTGPIHIGRIRNSLIGDSLCRSYSFYGYDVDRHYYVNDIGKQVAIIAWGEKNKIKPTKELVERYKKYKNKPEFKKFFVYVQAYKKFSDDLKVQVEIDDMLRHSEGGDVKTLKLISKTAREAMNGLKQTLKNLNIEFDSFDYESDFIIDGSAMKIVKQLEKLKEYRVIENGAKALDLSEYGYEKKSGGTVFMRANGTTVYILRDIAYHLWKQKQAPRLLNVLGEDHKLEFLELKKMLELLDKEVNVDVCHYSFITLKGKKMSTRRGQTAPVDKLIDDGVKKAMNEVKKRNKKLKKEELEKVAEKIAKGAIKYLILKIDKNKPIGFSWDDALKFEGETGPYCQYACVRAKKIMDKCKKPAKFDASNLKEKEEIELLRLLNEFEINLGETVRKNEPSILAHYVYNLAYNFSKFYEKLDVLKEENKEIKAARIALIFKFHEILEKTLELIGIEVPEIM